MNELDKAQLRAEMRQMYREVGIQGSFQCLFELLTSANLLLEIIYEERYEEIKKEKGMES